MITVAKNVKNQHLLYLGALQFSLSYPTDSGCPKSCKSHCAVGKENGASEISHQ